MNETVVTPPCPPRETLATYAQGRLPEEQATVLAEHLAFCERCQKLVDGLTPEEDSLVLAIRDASSIHQTNDPQLARLIAAAAKIDTVAPAAPRTRVAETPAAWPTVVAFVERLKQSRLMAASQIEGIVDELQPATAEALASALLARNRLTAYQVAALRRGEFDHLVLGNYTVLGELGEGGMGCVYKARHQRMGRTVCLKVLHPAGRKSPQLVERFRREAKTVAALAHPNIVAAHDAAEEDGVPFLVMEYIEGKDLAQYVREHGPLDVSTAIEIVLQTARALDYAHGQGVVHRDIKPANLLLALGSQLSAVGRKDATDNRQPIADSPLVKILDLGLARFDTFLADEFENSASNTMTAMGVVMGTVDYMSPEQALNSRTADARSDIYSLGCTLFYLLTGRSMFGGDTAMERIVAHREHAPPMLIQMRHDVSFELHAVFLNMVAKRPNERYQSMAEVARDLELVIAGRSPVAVSRSQPLLDPPPLPIRRRDGLVEAIKWAILLAVVCGIVALGAWLVASTDWSQVLSMQHACHGFSATELTCDNARSACKIAADFSHNESHRLAAVG